MTQEEKIKEIKKRFRLAMNGVVSTIQRRQGLDYKINFGVEVNRIKSIASDFEQDATLADALWKENIRESKLMAVLLMPITEFPANKADEWIANTKFTEIAEHIVRYLIVPQPFAAEKAAEYIKKNNGLYPYCGYLIYTYLLRANREISQEQETIFLKRATELLGTVTPESHVVQRSAYNALLQYLEKDNAIEHIKATAVTINEGTPLAMLLQE